MKVILIRGFVIILLLLRLPLSGQTDYTWWNIKHNWDGTTHWVHYMILSPEYLGPNALPVPDLTGAKLTSIPKFEAGFEGHYSKGDQTANLYTDLYLPLFTDRAALKIGFRPVEIYRTDTITRDERFSREYDPSGYCIGDVYISTFIQIVRDHEFLPDIMISTNIKTASGTKLEGARNSDTPGYWFDGTFGKEFRLNNPSIESLSLYARAGFYVYHTFDVNYYQNDAFLYGAGMQLSLKKISIHNQVTGYAGYMNNGDQPIVYRLIMKGVNNKILTYKFIFQQGLHDFPYSSIRISMILKLNKLNISD